MKIFLCSGGSIWMRWVYPPRPRQNMRQMLPFRHVFCHFLGEGAPQTLPPVGRGYPISTLSCFGSGVVGLESTQHEVAISQQTAQLQLFDWRFDELWAASAQNFQDPRFSAPNIAFSEENFSIRRKLSNRLKFGGSNCPLPPFHDATALAAEPESAFLALARPSSPSSYLCTRHCFGPCYGSNF